MDIVISDAEGVPIRQVGDYRLDLAYGDDENRFELSGLSCTLRQGSRWWVDGTSWGGVVDTLAVDKSAVSYKGRDIHGIMAAKVLQPDAGQSHLVVSGDANSVIAHLIERCSLAGWFGIKQEGSGFSVNGYIFRRYTDLWTGLRMMLSSCGARLEVVFIDGSPILSAVPADTFGDIPSERVDFSAERTYRPVNHLIGLGTGEGASREVVHWYADASGNVSQVQTLTGLDEVEEAYDLSNESDDLSGKTRDRLREMHGQGTASISIPDDSGLDVGDSVRASNADAGIGVTAQVTKVIVKATSGEPSVSYETGTPEWPEEEA